MATPTSQSRASISPPGSANSSPKVKLKNQINVANSKAVAGAPVLAKKVKHDASTQFGPSDEEQIVEAVVVLKKNKFRVLDEAENDQMELERREDEMKYGILGQNLMVKEKGVQALAVLINHLMMEVSMRGIHETKMGGKQKREEYRLQNVWKLTCGLNSQEYLFWVVN